MSKFIYQSHPYHLVSPSPWPLAISLNLLSLTTSGVLVLHNFGYSSPVFFLSLFLVISTMALWFRDIVIESTYLGCHTLAVVRGINMGFLLFIISEAMFFLAIFWAFFHSSLSPSIEVAADWPPKGIAVINPFELPLLNTVILLSSGFTVTYAHHSLISGNRKGTLYGIMFTVILAIIFTAFQGVEYIFSGFSISDGIYGSCFYFATGFHGLHVIIGTIFLAVAFVRVLSYNFTNNHHLGFESGILYWHFVDVIWLFLYLSVYYWGS